MDDRPGTLAALTVAYGREGVNILAFQVMSSGTTAIDEFVIDAPESIAPVALATTAEQAGGREVTVTRVDDAALADLPTRYLHAVHEILEEERDLEDVLSDLLATAPPDVADYAGHDVLELRRRDGTVVRVSRAVPFTLAERNRATALVSLVSNAGIDVPAIAPSARTGAIPVVREATLADIDLIAALHERCGIETLYRRYRVPLRMPMTTRMARRLVAPEVGASLVVQAGTDLVAQGSLVPENPDVWTFEPLIEDDWRNHRLGAQLIREAVTRARAGGARRLTIISAGSDDMLLRHVGGAGFVARVERVDDTIHITIPL
ncbi:hypothetical protein BHE97_09965 [Aeromicrobium sp. PE09-221]|nr:hypothetical protein BHE97_09965 [Aeromicrobium sp. PE09-221]